MINLVIEKIKEGTLLYHIQKTIKGISFAIKKYLRYHNAHYFLNHERVFTKRFLDTLEPINENHIKVGNYYLDKRKPLNESSIVYSIGILNEISFDTNIAKMFDSQVFMYDPTPMSIDFMKQYADHKNFNFFPFGLWIENTTLKFYLPNDNTSASIFQSNTKSLDNHKEEKYFIAPCKTLEDLMIMNNHQSIDVLKMDIEGAALPILEQIVASNFLPTQIVVELERPINDIHKNIEFFYQVMKLTELMKQKRYEIFLLPRGQASYFSIELLCVKMDKE